MRRLDRNLDSDFADAGEAYHTLTDHMFSVRALTEPNPNAVGHLVRERFEYDSYGMPQQRHTADFTDDGQIDSGDLSVRPESERAPREWAVHRVVNPLSIPSGGLQFGGVIT
jgi:hypothetical protein